MSEYESPSSIHLSNLIKKTKEKGYDGLLLTEPNNIKYLSNYDTKSFAFAILSDNPVVYATELDLENAKLNSQIEVRKFESLSALNDDLVKEGLTNFAIESTLPISLYEKFSDKFSGKLNLTIDHLIEDERMVKSYDEIVKIQEATKIAQKAFTDLDVLSKYDSGASEWEVSYELGRLMRDYGAESESFDTIVTSGSNSSLPHAEPEHKELETPILIDWGAKYKGYCSDNTRTIVFSEKQQEIFDIVLEAHDKTIESIKEGMKACEVDKIARDIITEYGYGDKYIHSTGHSLGLDIHENPNVSTRTETVLEKNMFITVEPGIYLEGNFGVRVEDTVLIDKKAHVIGDLPRIII
ncbi:Xaa-Pro peptidase family protein [Methanobrevibacter sp. AbM4]|uniref:M24 family metallopeptidase n=1 Tax=Methanobrevibacter sp. AbM4 TaxID=224719 RepID=UPI0003348EE3|nr:aminopeptidase P family protein [Methanobrevibacter sp. AbM4]AGN16307.1 Xaa-Pro aminopeptidase [Methanobrevibacter sp. AbM4]